jgi:two-component sensor histidine kinase
LVCVVVATMVRIGLGFVSPDSAVFAPYYSATLLAALVGGAAAGGVCAIVGGIVAIWLFVPPDWNVSPFVKEQIVSLLLFGTSSVIIVCAAESYRRLLWRVRQEQETRRLLNRELDHRVKNILASVQAIVNQTLRDRTGMRDEIGGRICALASTNDLLTRSEWRGASLREILTGEFAPYGLSRFDLSGDDVECPAALAIPLALIVHELATNASKYGALSSPDGRIRVEWKKQDDRLDLQWVERGGPPPKEPVRSGFGTKLLEMSLRQLNGVIDRAFEPGGLRLRLSVSLPPCRPQKRAAVANEMPRRSMTISRPTPSALSGIH